MNPPLPTNLSLIHSTVINSKLTNHVGIGTDLDGGFGTEQSPMDINTIADLQKIPDLLLKRGFSNDDISKICHQNWINFLVNHWS